MRTAILSDADGLHFVKVGDAVANGYRVTAIREDAVELSGPRGSATPRRSRSSNGCHSPSSSTRCPGAEEIAAASASRAPRRPFATAGVQGEVSLTERRGHARELAAAAVGRGATLVVAWGGDGTVNEVASALVARARVAGDHPVPAPATVLRGRSASGAIRSAPSRTRVEPCPG